MKCDMGGCPNDAIIECEWGLYEPRDGIPRTEPMNKALLCKTCSDDLWRRVKGAVNAGIMHWVNREVRKDDEIEQERKS